MALTNRSRMTSAEFLAWYATRPPGQRYELVDGEIVEMAAERTRHVIVKNQCWLALRRGIEEASLPCVALGDGMTVVVDEHDTWEPDATVQCGDDVDLDAIVAPAPAIVVEVLSPSTGGVDTGKKLGYFRLASIEHYLVLDPVRCSLVHHRRVSGDDDGCRIETSIHADGALALDPPGLELDVGACFASIAARG